ncbi:myo-inositol 2-dehydrogenase / D-chiro-inositol 1-dehydrogenase/scyllo-inositol 2-dehydrogenase (NAD+) [Verrucomicrobium sp. GAS474]|uniref:Gfo/Idh/MocA family oxidoreductase n=1 Tax=Verrucomicrobium sp. GAS474 TaxID=1882831 RepID=UPI0008797BB4|nr:Gfo/Idh/MocA family oxidoreductase [Verrucomicrobium sp. GAS474]SDT98745.1 myo-inositol 2-dehydrogenase / D-chiro-inositol 1-dehydrogenase/scyllo-inositol 2-dehydrogenase (NAD+) [Verrucomicrobium sp. GAS474]
MSQQPLRIAIVGTGRAGMIHAGNFSRSVPDARVTAVSDAVAESRETAARDLALPASAAHADYREAVTRDDVDAVVIATPTSLHREIAEAAAAAGKHIFCEKPMAMRVDECDAMIAAAAKGKVNLQIGFMRRFDAGFRAAKARVEAGEIGEVVQVKTLTHGPSYPRPWMFDLAKSNGPLAEVNSHDIDTVRWFSGGEFTEVHAIAGNYRTPEAVADYPDFYDQVLLTARLSNGAQGSISGAQGVQYAYDARCEILGTHGLITIGSLRGDTVMVCTREKELRSPAIVSWMNLFREAYLAEDIEFATSIREGRPPAAAGKDGRAAVAVVNAGNQSIRERKPVTL